VSTWTGWRCSPTRICGHKLVTSSLHGSSLWPLWCTQANSMKTEAFTHLDTRTQSFTPTPLFCAHLQAAYSPVQPAELTLTCTHTHNTHRRQAPQHLQALQLLLQALQALLSCQATQHPTTNTCITGPAMGSPTSSAGPVTVPATRAHPAACSAGAHSAPGCRAVVCLILAKSCVAAVAAAAPGWRPRHRRCAHAPWPGPYRCCWRR